MKYLLVLAVVLIAFYIWRNNRLTDRSEAAPKAPSRKPDTPAIMVACLQCGTHLPDSEAVRGRDGAYCSIEHQRLHEGNAG
ncbi:MAG: PP0621 family protein [Hydrogenophaga sp.]|uniref:PP0621 family protein n=1 Tax=Hydrogenophaga sp. TaxID=1904254 RepID=UPI003D0C700C